MGDGRRFLADRDERWDAIVVDAFFTDAIPFHLVTQDFLQLARSQLVPHRVSDGPRPPGDPRRGRGCAGPSSRLFRSIYRMRTFLAQRCDEIRAGAPTARRTCGRRSSTATTRSSSPMTCPC